MKKTLFDLSDLIYHVETPLSVSLTTSFILYFFRVYKPTSYNNLKRTPLFISSSSRIKTRIPVTVVDPAASTRPHIESKLRVQNRCTHSVDSYLNTLIWTADCGIKCLHNVRNLQFIRSYAMILLLNCISDYSMRLKFSSGLFHRTLPVYQSCLFDIRETLFEIPKFNCIMYFY